MKRTNLFNRLVYLCYNLNMKKVIKFLFVILIIGLYIYFEYYDKEDVVYYSSNNIPLYSGEDVIILNNNEPSFKESDFKTTSFEEYGDLDSLGRCTYAFANIGTDLMPTKERERISDVKPTGWHYKEYSFIEDGILYNRCHLIAYQLTAENSNKENLITCTKHTNSDLMNEYEMKVGNYIRKTKNHVLYRVTPVFDNDNLVAKGVQMEACSVEDNCEGIKFNIFIYNVQDGIEIDYSTGDSKVIEKN